MTKLTLVENCWAFERIFWICLQILAYILKKKAAASSEIKHLHTRLRGVIFSDPLQPSQQKCKNEPQNSNSFATHSIPYPSYYTLNTVPFLLHTQHCTLPTTHSTLYTSYYTLNTVPFPLHTQHCTLPTTHSTLYPSYNIIFFSDQKLAQTPTFLWQDKQVNVNFTL